ncbi:hypothetical protein CEXT_31811, partial [Caerostris extrusa]
SELIAFASVVTIKCPWYFSVRLKASKSPSGCHVLERLDSSSCAPLSPGGDLVGSTAQDRWSPQNTSVF